jgi:hypothetical protein
MLFDYSITHWKNEYKSFLFGSKSFALSEEWGLIDLLGLE